MKPRLKPRRRSDSSTSGSRPVTPRAKTRVGCRSMKHSAAWSMDAQLLICWTKLIHLWLISCTSPFSLKWVFIFLHDMNTPVKTCTTFSVCLKDCMSVYSLILLWFVYKMKNLLWWRLKSNMKKEQLTISICSCEMCYPVSYLSIIYTFPASLNREFNITYSLNYHVL